MNERAYSLVIMHRNDLASLSGAASISLHAQKTWTLFLVIAVSDEAVISLSEDLGLALDIERQEGWWRRTAVGEREGGALRCAVWGPRHRGQPPDSRAERAARMATAPVTLTAEQVLEAFVGADLRARGLRSELVDESALRVGDMLLDVLVLDEILETPQAHQNRADSHRDGRRRE